MGAELNSISLLRLHWRPVYHVNHRWGNWGMGASGGFPHTNLCPEGSLVLLGSWRGSQIESVSGREDRWGLGQVPTPTCAATERLLCAPVGGSRSCRLCIQTWFKPRAECDFGWVASLS